MQTGATEARRSFLPLMGVLLPVFLIYATSLRNGFVTWDDEYLVYANPWLRAITPHTLQHIVTSYDPHLYIPLTFLSYQIEIALFGLNPAVFHATNLLLHLSNVAMVFWLVAGITKHRISAAFAALLWGVHPLNAEAVLWVSARKEVLSAAFLLASLHLWRSVRGSLRLSPLVGALLLFTFALASKVSAIVLPGLLLTLDRVEGYSIDRRTLRRLLPFLLPALLFGIVALFGKREGLAALSAVQVIALWLQSAAACLQRFLWPSSLSILYPYEGPVLLLSLRTLISAGILAFLFFVVWLLRRRAPAMLAGVLWYLFAFIPIFATFSKGTGINLAADHYAYVPLIGVCMAIGGFIARIGKGCRTSILILLCSVLLVYAFLMYKRIGVWHDSRSLYIDVLSRYPDNVVLRSNLGLAEVAAGDDTAAMAEFETVLHLHPQHAGALNNKGYLLLRTGKSAEARKNFEAALAADPKSYEAHNNLGILLMQEGNTEEAIAAFEQAVAINPAYVRAWHNLADACGKQGRYREGLDALRTAMALDPGRKEELDALGEALKHAGGF